MRQLEQEYSEHAEGESDLKRMCQPGESCRNRVESDIGRNRLVSLKMESVAVKWRVVSGSRKLSNSENFKDIFISPDLTRKQAEEDRKLRLKLKETI